MNAILAIFVRDLRRIVTNPAAAVVIAGLVALPSLYAWFNIQASWDPYAHTDKLPVAVVNEDAGTTLRGQAINAGKEIVAALKNNTKIGWTFVDKKEALRGVRYGDYYAAIVLPPVFSARLATVLEAEPKPAEIDYYVNEKINAIAPKIASSGASGVVEEISRGFVQTASGIIFGLFNQIGAELEANLPEIERLRSLIFELEAKFPDIRQAADTAQDDVGKLNRVVATAKAKVPVVAQLAKDGEALAGDIGGVLAKGQAALDTLAPQLKQDLAWLRQTAAAASTAASLLRDAANASAAGGAAGAGGTSATPSDSARAAAPGTADTATDTGGTGGAEAGSDGAGGAEAHALAAQGAAADAKARAAQAAADAAGRLDAAAELAARTLALLQQLNALQPGAGRLAAPIASLQAAELGQQQQRAALGEARAALAKGEAPAAALADRLSRLSADTDKRLGQLLGGFDTDVAPRIAQAVRQASAAAAQAQSALAEAVAALPTVSALLDRAGQALAVGSKELAAVRAELPAAEQQIHALADKLRAFEKQASLRELIGLLRLDAQRESAFFAQPVALKENKLFPIEGYGSAMSPFFTTLALWVGALLLVSLLTTGVHEEGVRYLSYEVYFGRYLTFATLALLQSLLVTLGDLYLLGTDVADKAAFVLFGLLIAAVFMLIVYTLVSVFDNVGKAMAIVLLVLQLAGAGGTFPIQLTPPFFQAIHPFLPFTFAIGLMREAAGGILAEVVRGDMLRLLLFAESAVIVGLALKRPINRLTAGMVARAKESKLIH